jgi:signal transduction histidine kinase
MALGVLIVDDNRSFLGAARDLLEREGMRVVGVSSTSADVRATARLPERVEMAAYYIVSEALTNAAKHARASVVRVCVEAGDHILYVGVDDDGQGGADLALGTGLLGLKDRAEAIGGTMSLQSAPGEGTSLRVELPLDDQEQYPIP